jgi:hypothetical protein
VLESGPLTPASDMPQTSQVTSTESPAPTGTHPGSSLVLDGLLAVAAVLFGASLALPWSRSCQSFVAIGRFCSNISGWRGLGGLAGLFDVVLLALWALSTARPSRSLGRARRAWMRQTVLAVAIFALTAGELFLDRSSLAFGAWIGLALALAVAVLTVARLRSPVEGAFAGPAPGP